MKPPSPYTEEQWTKQILKQNKKEWALDSDRVLEES